MRSRRTGDDGAAVASRLYHGLGLVTRGLALGDELLRWRRGRTGMGDPDACSAKQMQMLGLLLTSLLPSMT
jgi:hypothetical protein